MFIASEISTSGAVRTGGNQLPYSTLVSFRPSEPRITDQDAGYKHVTPTGVAAQASSHLSHDGFFVAQSMLFQYNHHRLPAWPVSVSRSVLQRLKF